jgi:hypothetical protein
MKNKKKINSRILELVSPQFKHEDEEFIDHVQEVY